MVKSSYLLDTHILIWWLKENPRLTPLVKKLLADRQNTIYISVINIWEMYIKVNKQKLELPRNWEKVIEKTGFNVLPVSLLHVRELSKLGEFHKDPFDRMLIAQAQSEKLTIITDDVKIRKYKVKVKF